MLVPPLLTALVGLVLGAPPATEWVLNLPSSRVPVQQWMVQAGFEEQRGSAENWYVQGGILHLVQDDDSTTVGTKRGFPVDADRRGRLRFEVRADTLPAGADLKSKGTEDAAFRLFVVFDRGGGIFSPPDTLGYAWATARPVGAVVQSERFDNVHYVVVASGPKQLGRWITVQRDVAADYRRIFGRADVPPIVAVAFKSDANDTGTRAASRVRGVRFSAR